MTVINMAAVVNEDVFFLDDDKKANLVELWAQNVNVFIKQQVKNIRTEAKEAKLISVYSNFGQKAPKEPKFLSPLYPGSCPKCRCPVALRLRLLRKISRITSNTCLLLRYTAILNNLLVMRAQRC